MAPFKAILFDVQGTLVDYVSSIGARGDAILRPYDIAPDWPAFIAAWRVAYRQALDDAISGRSVWRSTDTIYREALDRLLPDIPNGRELPPVERDRLTALWAKLDPWPDTVAAMTRLRTRFALCALSNGSMASLIGIARHAGLPFDCILSAELVRSAKPDPEVYRLAVRSLALPPAEMLLVASHAYDLRAAASLGFPVAFLYRPFELGPVAVASEGREFALHFDDLDALERRIGA